MKPMLPKAFDWILWELMVALGIGALAQIPFVGVLFDFLPFVVALIVQAVGRSLGLHSTLLDDDELPGPISMVLGFIVVALVPSAWLARRLPRAPVDP